MRLTLRTLLAYLDDTLEPAQAKLIGQKVAESDTARELIARIKEVTRRRRITTPAAGSATDKVEPNNIASYLDNELSQDELADVEQLALASDVHLAEIAACHQILTVVLGEPAVVPPTAYSRMYGLVKPPESNPRHSPPVAREAEDAVVEGRDLDETLRLGLPAVRRGDTKNIMILLGGAACVLVLLGVAIWQLLPPLGSREGEINNVAKAPGTGKSLPPPLTTDSKGKTTGAIDTAGPKKETDSKGKPDEGKKPSEPDKPAVETKKGDEKDKVEPGGKGEPKDKAGIDKPKGVDPDAPAPPDPAVREIGHFDPPGPRESPAVLLQLLPDKTQPAKMHWTRLLRGKEPAKVLSNAVLVSLPGYRSIIQLDSGARLTLWGNVPEVSPFPVAIESVAVVHPNAHFDLDITLVRGRIAVANGKDQPFKVRMRFANPANAEQGQIWDVALLDKGAEVILNLAGLLPPGEQFFPKRDDSRRLGPMAFALMLVPTGTAELKIDLQAATKFEPPPKGPVLIWDSRRGSQLIKAAAMPPWVQPVPTLPEGFDLKLRKTVLDALDKFSIDLGGPNVDPGLMNAMNSNDIQKRRLVVRTAGAMNDLKRVIDALADKELEVRRAAIETLRIWIAAGRDNDYILFDQLKPMYTATDAETIMELLHSYAPDKEADPAVQNVLVQRLTHDKPAIRELAHDYLLRLYPDGRSIGYNALAPRAQLEQRAAEWRKRVQQGKKLTQFPTL